MNQIPDVDRKYPNESVLSATEQTTVYRSTDQESGAPVVVKIITTGGSPEDRAQSRRFLKVIGTLQSLKLGGFPRIIDFGIADERNAFLVMEPVEGEALFDRLGSPPDQILGLLAQIVDTLEALSRGGICHHNLTPGNIVAPTGGIGHEVRFFGLGTAAYLDRFMGSANPEDERARRYVAPERLVPGSHQAGEDWRADLFSVALIAAVMLEADVKGVGGTHPSVVLSIPVRAALVNPGNLGGVLEMALRGDPRQRQIGWSDLHDALRSQTPQALDLGATMAIPLDRLPQLDGPRVDEDAGSDGDPAEPAEPPTAYDSAYETNQDVALEISTPGVLDKDTDAEGNSLAATVESGPSNGDLRLEEDGSFTYLPKPDFFGVDSFTYRAGNGELESEPATVTITINEVKKPPAAVNDEYTTHQDVALTVPAPGVLGNDSDADGMDLTAVYVSGPSDGDLKLEADGSFEYQPHPGFFGVDSFTYSAGNGELESEPATATITVSEVKKPPVAGDDKYTTKQGAALEIPAPGVLENDSDPDGRDLKAEIVSGPTNGDLELGADGSFRYVPKPDYFGVDAFTYRADNGELGSVPATVVITVIEVKKPPVAADDEYATNQGVALTIPAPGVLGNDSDADGRDLKAEFVSGPTNGDLELESDGAFEYEPNPGFFGVDSFTYRAGNGELESNPATVVITVSEVKKPPVAADGEYSTNQDEALEIPAPGVLGTGRDFDGRVLTALLVSGPSSGNLELEADGSFEYEPHPGFFGGDSFTYRADDGELESYPATITITVKEVKKPPVTVEDEYATAQDEVLEVTAPGVLDNDFAQGGEPLEAVLVSDPVSGRLTLEKDGSFTYVPRPGFHGVDAFTYKARGGGVDSETTIVTVTVLEVVVVPPDEPGEPKITDEPEIEPAPPQPPSEPVPPPKPPPPPTEEPEPTPVPPPLPKAVFQPPPVPEPEAKPVPPPPPESPPMPEKPPEVPRVEPAESPRSDEPGWRRLVPDMSHRNMAILAGVLAVIVVILIVVFWPDSSGETQTATPEATPLPTAVPTRTPVPFEAPPTISVSLENAQDALIEGDSETARGELMAITEEEIARFSDEERALYDELTTALEGGELDRAVKDLRGGLWWSSVKMLRRAVAELAELDAEELAEVPGLDVELERAREALRIHALMYEAHDGNETVAVLEHASALIAILPDYSRALVLREEAAAALEADADADAANGNFDGAFATIEPISRYWPQREGQEDRLARYRRLQSDSQSLREKEAEFQALLRAAAERGESGLPDEGLRMLRNRAAPESLTRQRASLVEDLTVQLAEMDASAPEVEVAPDIEIVYKKNQPIVILFRITDDYRVEETVLMIRAQGSSEYRDLPLSGPDGENYRVEIGPDVHQNGAIELYVEARDISNNVGRLGSSSEPLLLKRRGLFKKILEY